MASDRCRKGFAATLEGAAPATDVVTLKGCDFTRALGAAP
jgi:hypothetical protein